LHSDELASLSASSEPALAALAAAVRGAAGGAGAGDDTAGAFVAARVPLHGDASAPPLRAALAAALAPACGELREVGAGAGAALSRESYAVRRAAAPPSPLPPLRAAALPPLCHLSAPSLRPARPQAALAAAPAAGAAACVAYLVPLRRSDLVSELAAVARFSASAAAGGAHAFVLTAEAAPLPAYVAADDLAEAAVLAAHRKLQAAGAYSSVGNIRMNPDILVGLVIGLFLAFILLIGVQCTMAVKTPDVMHSFALPAGREY